MLRWARRRVGAGTITNDDPVPSVTATYRVSGEPGDNNIAEDYSPATSTLSTANSTLEVPEAVRDSATTLKLAVELSNPHYQTVTVAWSIVSGTDSSPATLRTDFGSGTSSGNIRFTSG